LWEKKVMPIGNSEKPLKGWKSVWLKAVALSWKNSTFKQELICDPRTALAHHFGYTLPSYVDLTVFDPLHPKAPPPPAPAPGKDDKYGYYPTEGGLPWVMPNNQINLPLPPCPERAEDQAIALASFSSSNSYPFSTC
jgi:ribosomally synthesized peptide (two-chain TOMM family)